MKRLGDIMKDMAGGGTAVGRAFARMGIAEEEIEAAGLTKEQGSKAFKAACPPDCLADKADPIYRAHVRELIARIKAGADLKPATDAELCAVFSDTSLKAPLHRNAAAAYEVLFERVTGRLKIGGETVKESWPGAATDEIEAARKKFRVETR